MTHATQRSDYLVAQALLPVLLGSPSGAAPPAVEGAVFSAPGFLLPPNPATTETCHSEGIRPGCPKNLNVKYVRNYCAEGSSAHTNNAP
jgi:hypothetical protein